MIDPSDLIPDPDSETIAGDPVDIVEALKAKREAAETLLPHMKPPLKKVQATASGDRYDELKRIEDALKGVAEHFDIDYDSL